MINMGSFYPRKHNEDPKNPYRPGTMIAALYEEDFSDLTAKQIAEVFDVDVSYIYKAALRIKRETGRQVNYLRMFGK